MNIWHCLISEASLRKTQKAGPKIQFFKNKGFETQKTKGEKKLEKEATLHKDLSLDTQHHHHHNPYQQQQQQFHHQNPGADVNARGESGEIHHHLVAKSHQLDSFYTTHLRLQQSPQHFPQLDPYVPLSGAPNPNQALKKRSLNAKRVPMRSAGAGEIVDVPGGGRIVRSAAGRKDRHSKVCTAKGPRDRRVRLAAHTAIQFYDVQDRLGYDRPSKAVDWLMKKAKSAIDALDELPSAWRPPPPVGNNNNNNNLLPPSMESDSIADTIKSFFPMGGHEGSPAMQFQSYPSSDCKQSQDLKLSLQSLHDPMMIQSHHHSNQCQEGEDQQRSQFGSHSHQGQEEQDQQQSQFPGAAQIGFGHPSPNWDDESQHQTDSGRLQRLIGWNFGGYGGGGGNGFMFNPHPHPPQTSLQQQQMLLSNGSGHSCSHLYPQGGPLQSNFTPLATATSSQDHHHHHHHDQSVAMHPTMSFPGIGLGSSGGFLGFRIPARIQGGDEEEQDGNPNKPFSLSSASRH